MLELQYIYNPGIINPNETVLNILQQEKSVHNMNGINIQPTSQVRKLTKEKVPVI